LGLIIAKAMAPEPAHRYASVPGLAADVGRFLDSRPVLARGPGAAYVARKFAAAHKAATAALAVVAVSLTAAGVWAAASQRRAERYYRTSRDTAEFLLSDVVIPLSDQIGSRSVRRAVLSRLLEQTGEFALQEAEDADVQAA